MERKKVMIVDDQAAIRLLLSEVFEEEGYTVLVAESGYDALEIIKHTVPDILVLDIKMPGLSGIEVLREVKKIIPDIKSVAITAYGEIGVIKEALSLGAIGYLTKPFDLENLKEIIHREIIEKVNCSPLHA